MKVDSDSFANARLSRILRVEARREFRLGADDDQFPRLQSGWAAELIVLHDGRRQVTGLFLPGERVISSPLARDGEASTLLAITPLELHLEEPRSHASELEALRVEISAHLSNAFRSLVRLGCLTAYEKTANMLLEIAERTGATQGETIEFPLTQELMADMLGLSQVHVNRTLQQLRRDGLIELQGGRLSILRPEGLLTAGQYRALFRPRPGAGAQAGE